MFEHTQFSSDLKMQKLNYLQGVTVDYQLLTQYIKELEQVDLLHYQTDEQKIAFWVNVYNGLTNYWIITLKLRKNMREAFRFFTKNKTIIGGYSFSLHLIENGLLRGNRTHRMSFFRPLYSLDKRLSFRVHKVDYRIHFALNCGATSCPPIAYYTAAKLNEQLSLAAESFCTQEFIVDTNKKKILCSRIFWLYRQDFDHIYINDPLYKGYCIGYTKYDHSIV